MRRLNVMPTVGVEGFDSQIIGKDDYDIGILVRMREFRI